MKFGRLLKSARFFGLIYEATKQLGSTRTLRIVLGVFTSPTKCQTSWDLPLGSTLHFNFSRDFQKVVLALSKLFLFYFIFLHSPTILYTVYSILYRNEWIKLLNLERYIEQIGKIYFNFGQEIYCWIRYFIIWYLIFNNTNAIILEC